ncbi:MAG TPA: NAD(P)-dependent oxidoreductase [Gammaproteobacteria bacterium]|nr:NAD(P)-dependent oxidoreductase [Gammaproteobacteria bacterium]
MTVNVVFTGPQDAIDWLGEELGNRYSVTHVAADAEKIARALEGAEVLLDASMKIAITAPMIDTAESLKLVITATTGADHIDAAALQSRGIPLKTLRGETAFLRDITPAAELTWLLLMACARRLRAAVRHVENGEWDREQFPGRMLRGRTVGVVGCGRVGTWVSRYARAFDMRVIGYDPLVTDLAETIERAPLNEVFSEADFVVLTVTFAPETAGLIGAAELGRMKEGAALINTSRGAIVREEDLLDGLISGRPAFLGVDVLEGEPDIRESPIWQYASDHDNVIITPHIGGFSRDALEQVLRHTAKRIIVFFEGDQAK